MVRRTLGVALLAVGVSLAALGAALVLNLLSLRDLAARSGLDPAITIVFEARDEMSHRRAQTLELGLGLGGVALAGAAAWWLFGASARTRL